MLAWMAKLVLETSSSLQSLSLLFTLCQDSCWWCYPANEVIQGKNSLKKFFGGVIFNMHLFSVQGWSSSPPLRWTCSVTSALQRDFAQVLVRCNRSSLINSCDVKTKTQNTNMPGVLLLGLPEHLTFRF